MNKAAPIQISWAGYPGFLGIPEIDYIIGDKDFHDTQLALYTNGALLHKYIEKLSVFENLIVVDSII